MEISEIFVPRSGTVYELLREPGRGFYIPAYQRPYSWDKVHLDRLFDDLCHGVSTLLDSAHALTFLGTIITINDTKYTTVDPKVESQLPSGVMTVIDGQQRLTTLMLFCAALHDELTRRAMAIQASDDEADSWLADEVTWTTNELQSCFEIDMQSGKFRYYPRMARAYLDKWSRKENECQYHSPVASFLHGYGQSKRRNAVGVQPYDHPDESPIKAQFDAIVDVLTTAIAEELSQEQADGLAFPATSEMVDSQFLLRNELFQGEIPKFAVDRMADGEYSALFRQLVFARFVLNRVAITNVVATSEEYAFDMFEALNTTGEPLTAIETFKPRVVQGEGHGAYEGSKSQASFGLVEKYLSQFKKAEDRQRATSELLIPFALAEDGCRLSSRLNGQRKYLISRFGRHDTKKSQREFVEHLGKTAQIMDNAWKPKGDEVPFFPGVEISEEALFSLSVLVAAGHTITLGPLTRVYSLGQPEELSQSLKAMAAFFGLWRGAFGQTNNIDGLYRSMMSDAKEGDHPGPFSRTRTPPAKGEVEVISSERLVEYFVSCLSEKGLSSKDTWVAKAVDTPIYKRNKSLSRLLVLAATHDSVVDPKNNGLRMAGKVDVLKVLTRESWLNDKMISVEHIAPRTREDSWSSSLYDDDHIERLGNLILAPKAENAAISNSPWNVKRACYRVLSATSQAAAAEARAEAVSAGIDLPPSILNATDSETYLPLAADVATVTDEDWSVEMIEKRTKRMLELSWDRLAPWLGL